SQIRKESCDSRERVDAATAAPKPELIDAKWKATGSGGDPNYGPWAEFLSRRLSMGSDGVALLDYAGGVGDRAQLSAWLAETQKVDPTTLSSDAAFAWWVNLYNAVTIDLVLGDYPVDSIKEVKGGLFNTGPWGEKVAAVNGDRLSLDDIEHGILRPIWKDPRIHYAVNCASIGCPNLKATPWTSATLEADLNAGAKAYVNHPRGARLDGDKLVVSKIYEWFDEDFDSSDAGVIAHLRQYAEGDLAAGLASADRIADTEYDWDLNAA
ncbi:MAG: DUF547 domain-containing protein, partial [Pseudomonadota bacterium]